MIYITDVQFSADPKKYIEMARGTQQVTITKEGQPATIIGVGEQLFPDEDLDLPNFDEVGSGPESDSDWFA